MTAREQKMYRNIEKWRNLPESKRRGILRSATFRQAVGSMAMEGEPVSAAWIKKNKR